MNQLGCSRAQQATHRVTVAVLYTHRLCPAAQQQWQRHESGGLGPVQVALIVVLQLTNALATMAAGQTHMAALSAALSFMSHRLSNTGRTRRDCPWQGMLRPVVALHTLMRPAVGLQVAPHSEE